MPFGVTPDPDDEPLPLIRVHEPPAPQDGTPPSAPAVEEVKPTVEVPEQEREPETASVEAVEDAPPAVVAPLEEVEAPPEHAAGELRLPEGVVVYEGFAEGARRTVGIAVSRYNGEVTNRLLDGAIEALEEAGVTRDRIDVMAVPGAFELPLAAMALAKTRRYSCIVAIGCVIRGDTPHFDYVCSEAASGLQLAGLETGVPVAFGVLTCDSQEQAEARAGGEHGNKGVQAVQSALEMADVFARLRASA